MDTGTTVILSGGRTVLAPGAATAANQATGNASLASIDGKLPALAGGRVPVETKQIIATVGANTSVAAAVVDTLLLAANAARKGATVYNDSVQNLRLNLGTTAASATNFTVLLGSGAYYEVPFAYTGEIRGIWGAAVGSARMTELT